MVKSQPRKNQSERFYLYPWWLPRHLIIRIRLLLIQFKINLWVLVSTFSLFFTLGDDFSFSNMPSTQRQPLHECPTMVIQSHIPPQSVRILILVWSHVFCITSVTCDLPIFISHPAVNFKSSPYLPFIKKANPVPVENIFIPHPQLKILSSRTPHLWLYSSYPQNHWAFLQIPYTHLHNLCSSSLFRHWLADVWLNDITQGKRLKEATWRNSS